MFKPPLSVYFVWHPLDADTIKPIVDHCSTRLQRDVNQPFSRAMNLPIFYRTTAGAGVPAQIESLSEKTMVFIFLGEEIVASDAWVSYLQNLPEAFDFHSIVVAMDSTAVNIGGDIAARNFIWMSDHGVHRQETLFISIAHEIYRYALNASFKQVGLGERSALKIFLSYAKHGPHGIKIAQALKDIIESMDMKKFFDATDIAAGLQFEQEIVGHIKNSSMIAIHSDPYSSRYWCQREILSAKEHNRPIVAVDCLETFEDRRFPFASNVPGVHVNPEGVIIREDLLRILSATLLETIRFFYSKYLLKKYQQAGWIASAAVIHARPPEVSDIEKLLSVDGQGGIQLQHPAIVYPEPPVYREELSFLSKLGLQMDTPLTSGGCILQGQKIGISISEPSTQELVQIGQNSAHLVQLSQDLARHLLTRESTLIYGGDLREGGFTEFLFNEAQALQARLQTQNIHLNNYIAWPNFNNDSESIKKWKANYRLISTTTEVAPPDAVKDLIPDENVFLPPSNAQNLFVWSCCLSKMRMQMIAACTARICAGGRPAGYKGKMPGVLEEILIALDKGLPLFLLGGFGGVTASVCRLIQHKDNIPEELTEAWQTANNTGYADLLIFFGDRGEQYQVDYGAVADTIREAELNNGLSDEDNQRLFVTPFIDEAIHLVLKGLKSLVARNDV